MQRRSIKAATLGIGTLALAWPGAASANLYLIQQNGFSTTQGTTPPLYAWQLWTAAGAGSSPPTSLGLQNQPTASGAAIQISANNVSQSNMAGPVQIAVFGEPLNAGTFSTAALTAPGVQANLKNLTLGLTRTAPGGQQASFNLPLMTSQAFQTSNGSSISPPWTSTTGSGQDFPFVTMGIVSNGTAGYYKDNTYVNNNWANYTGGAGGSIAYTLNQSSLSVAGTAAPQAGSGLPWEPAGGGIYLGSIGGNGGGSYGDSLDGGNGGSITATFNQVAIQMTATGTAQAAFAGITASSVGGQAGICCVYDQLSNGNIDTSSSVLPRWSMTSVPYSGIDVPGSIGSRVTRYGQNGAGGSVDVDLTDSSITGTGVYLIGLSTSSLGGATQIPTNIPGSGNWEQNYIAGSREPMNWFVNSANNPNNLAIDYPGDSGDVTVTLSNSSISLTGSNLVGVLAASSASPFLIPTNVSHFINPAPSAGDVSISLDSASQISISDKTEAGFSTGVMAISTGGSNVLPFAQQNTIQNQGQGLPAGFGNGGNVTVNNAGQIAVSGATGIGILGLSGAGSTGIRQAGASQGDAGSPVTGATAGNVTLTNTGKIQVEATNGVGVAAISTGTGGVVHSLPAVPQGGSPSFINGSGSQPTNTFIVKQSGTGYVEGASTTQSIVGDSPVSHGGSVSVTNAAGALIQAGSWNLSSKVVYGILAQSVGSGGGLTLGGASGQLGSTGNAQGNGGSVAITNAGSVMSFGDSAVGVLAQSIGGGGGAGANSDSLFVAKGSQGGSGGNGGPITINFTKGSSVITNGDSAIGVLAHSIGGGGGHGGAAKSYGAFFDSSTGGTGGTGGDGGPISITSSGKRFWTAGQHAHGLVLQSIGGGGGVGGSANSLAAGVQASASVALGGTGGSGGAGGTIGPDGQSTPVQSTILTNDHDSVGIILQSIGKGGGLGGKSSAKSYAAGVGTVDPELKDVPTFITSVSLGGAGGGGGAGGSINYWHTGLIATYGDGSHGVMAQSIGGGGGSGGDATASGYARGSALANIKLKFSLGGAAGGGANGGATWVQLGSAGETSSSLIRTTGHDAMGVLAQSLGGGGGNAGTGNGLHLSVSFRPVGPGATAAAAEKAFATGTVGEAGKEFKDVASSSTNTLEVSAMQCLKVLPANEAGGEAKPGCGKKLASEEEEAQKLRVKLEIDVGRSGGGGGTGGLVTVTNNGTIYTAGSGSTGIFAQSVGGGGGKGTAIGPHASGGLVNVGIAVGGSGGSGAVGGNVSVLNQASGQGGQGGVIITGQRFDLDNPMESDPRRFTRPAVTGGDAHGIHAQSVGGGGGIGGNADPQNSALSSSMVADLLAKKVNSAHLKAVGIGSLAAPELIGGAKLLRWGFKGISPINVSFRPSIEVGGAGGSGGDGGNVSVGNSGQIETFGHRAYGVFAQSIGGGGGTGGAASSPLVDLASTLPMLLIDFSPSITVGGQGGAGGSGGQVNYTNGLDNQETSPSIITHGYGSHAIAAQSIGGGGGTAHEGSTFGLSDQIGSNGRVTIRSGVDFGNGFSKASYNPTASSAKIPGTLAFGSQDSGNSFGNSGAGGQVNLGTASSPLRGTLITHGNDAMGMVAQSIGGGGGLASLGCSNASPVNGAHDASACWGNTLVEQGAGQPGQFVGAAGAGGVAITVNGGAVAQNGYNNQTGSAGVAIYDGQQITTFGNRSMGLVSQSISGGGGFFSGPNRRINSMTMPSQQRTATSAGPTSINLNGSRITTYGDGGWGVLAQIIKGGGGFFGDSSQNLAFSLKYDPNQTAAANALAGPGTSNAARFNQPRVGNPQWSIGNCETTPSCNVNSLQAGVLYKIPFSQGTASWAAGDYVQLDSSSDKTYPYAVNQYSSTGAFKAALGNGRILNISASSFLLEGSDQNTGQFYSANTITYNAITIAGAAQPSLQEANQYLSEYYSSPQQALNTQYFAGNEAWPVLDPTVYFGITGVAAPEPSPLNVTMKGSSITTYGRNAHGMVLQNLGTVGGAWSADGTPLNLGVTLAGGNGFGLTPGGSVNLVMDSSSIITLGPQSRGVIIQSDGAGPGGQNGSGQIQVSLTNGSLIRSNQHTALMLVGGSYNSTTNLRNSITVDGTSSIQNGAYIAASPEAKAAIDDTDSSYNNWAIYAPAGYTNLTVSPGGSIYGNILLGITTLGDFTNQGDWHGSTFIGADQSLHNYGRIFPSGAGSTGRLSINGSLKHHPGAEIHMDVHPAGQGVPHDAINVSGLARLRGDLLPQTQSLIPGRYEVIQAGSLEALGEVRDSHAFNWQASADANNLTIIPHANFAPQGYALNRTQKSLAGYLQRAWDNADRSHAYTFGYLHEHDLGDHAGYRNSLNALSGQVLNSQAIQMKTGFASILGQGLACPDDTSPGTTLNQGNCLWAEAIGSIADQSEQASSPSYHAEAAGMRLGGQKQFKNQWQAGFAFGYANNTLTATGFSSSGTFADASVSAQKTIGAWSLGGSLALAQGWFDNSRTPQLHGNDAAASLASSYSSNSTMTIFGMRLRAAHTTVLNATTIKPYIDLDLYYNHQPGYDETGDLLALSAKTSQQFNVALTPMLEFGFSKLKLGDIKLEGFVSAGASLLPTNTITTRMAFSEAASANGSFDAVSDGPPLLGRLNLGLQLYKGSTIEARAEYGLQAGSGYWDQRVSAKLLYRF